LTNDFSVAQPSFITKYTTSINVSLSYLTSKTNIVMQNLQEYMDSNKSETKHFI